MPAPMKARWRAALALLGLVLAAAAVAQLRGYRGEQRALAVLAQESGAAALDPQLPGRLAREPDPWRARLRLARALLASAVSGKAAPATGRRLELARELASQVAAERPSSWEAPMVQGAAAYLGWSLQRDRRLLTEPGEWEDPLLRSLALAPGRPEPARFLAAAYIELWPALSRGKRGSARGLVARALAHRPTFQALVEPWLRTAGSREEAFSAIPGEPWAWEIVQQIAARDADWEGFRQARRRWYQSYEDRLRLDLAEAGARLRGGDAAGAGLLFHGVLQAPPRRRFVPVLESALAQAPPGAAGPSVAPAVRRWLDWSLDLCLWRQCPLPPPLLRRLAGLAGELEAPAAARAALAGGDLAAGELLERRAEETLGEPWAPYHIAHARSLLQRRELAAAQSALDAVHPAWRHTPPYVHARLDLARALGDPERESAALSQAGGLRRSRWTAREWRSHGAGYRLEILPAAEEAAGLEVEILGASPRGSVVEVRVDGGLASMQAVERGGRLVVRRALDGGPHLVEIEAVSGGQQLVPGTVRLLPAPDGR